MLYSAIATSNFYRAKDNILKKKTFQKLFKILTQKVLYLFTTKVMWIC